MDLEARIGKQWQSRLDNKHPICEPEVCEWEDYQAAPSYGAYKCRPHTPNIGRLPGKSTTAK